MNEHLETTAEPARVLMLAPQPFFLNRGTPINVRAMVEVLAEAGYIVDLLVYPQGEQVSLPGVSIIRAPGVPGIRSVPIGPSWQKLVLDVGFSFKAVLLVIKNHYDVLHGVEEAGCLAGALGLLGRTRYVFDMDSCMVDQLSKSSFSRIPGLLALVRFVESFFIRKASAVLTVCEALSRKAKAVAPEVLLAQIEDFPFDSASHVDSHFNDQLREEFSLRNKRIAVYTGNFESYQGIDLLLEGFAAAFSDTESSDSPALVLVGGGELGSPKVRQYQDRAKALGIAEQVHFLGNRPAEEMGSFMNLADVLLSPRTEGENTPLKIYSYMAAERPVLATRIESHTQVLDDTNAFLADATPEAWAKTLRVALENSEDTESRRKELARSAKRLVETRYSKKEFCRRLLHLYQRLLGSRQVGGSGEEETREPIALAK